MIAALRFLSMVVVCLTFVIGSPAAQQTQPTPPGGQLKVFLDCQDCFQDFLRTEVTFVDYVRDRTEADVHVLITRARNGRGRAGVHGGLHRKRPPSTGVNHTLKTVHDSGDPDDVVRRQLATTMRIGLLNYVAQAGVPAELAVSVRLGSEESRPAVAGDRWNNWVFSLRGSASFNGEESSRAAGARRRSQRRPDHAGVEDHARQRVRSRAGGIRSGRRRPGKGRAPRARVPVARGQGTRRALVNRAARARSSLRRSTIPSSAIAAAPAIEYNVFPYSMYTRRQLRALYAVGVRRERYYERTLFGKTGETLPQHELSLTFEQRERWGSLEARTEWSQFLHDLTKSRLEVDGEVSVRLARGLSVGAK